jgi:hypothetical protein
VAVVARELVTLRSQK